MAEASYSDLALYGRLLRQARPYWLHMAGIVLLSLLSTPFVLLTPLPLKIAVDNVISNHPMPDFLTAIFPALAASSKEKVLILAVVLMLAVTLLHNLQQVGGWLMYTYTGEKLVMAFRSRLFSQAELLSLAYHDTKGTADSVYRIQSDAPSIRYVLIDGAVPFAAAGLTLASTAYVTARISLALALVAVAISPVLFLITQVYRQRLRSQWGDVKRLEASALSVAQEALGALRVVKAFGQERREEERFVRYSREGVRARLRATVGEGSFTLLVGFTIALGTSVVLYVGVRQVQSQAITLGELLLVMGYLSQLYIPLRTISDNVANLQSHLASVARAFALLEEAPEVAERPNARPIARTTGAVAFQNVSFTYDEVRPVLRNVSFAIKPGSRVGISGATGAGKTTLVSLLARFYDPADGQILIDGVDSRDYRLADLRHQFAIVLQEPILFSTSIAENIAYARPNATYEDIVTAAKAANIHEFIISLQRGYDTPVSERGVNLSGGERQRISLARAFLKDAPIVILDEPTSSVDMETEAAIMDAMERLVQGRTTFIITHRPSLLKDCDVLLRVENGLLSDLSSIAMTTDAQKSVLTTTVSPEEAWKSTRP